MISFVFDRTFRGLKFHILDAYEPFKLILGFYFRKMWKFLEKRPFFRADLARLGKYRTGGFGRIGVYRVNMLNTRFYFRQMSVKGHRPDEPTLPKYRRKQRKNVLELCLLGMNECVGKFSC